MENEAQGFQHDRSRVWGTLTCTLLGGLMLMLAAGFAVGFDPGSISTRSETFLFWTLFVAGIAVDVIGLARAKAAFETIERTEPASEM